MSTLPQPTVKAKYATVYDEPATIAKVGGSFYVIYDDGRIEAFELAMVQFTVVLGDVALAEEAAMWDRIAGGYAKVACSRTEGVQ
jgi:hypothetical protein